MCGGWVSTLGLGTRNLTPPLEEAKICVAAGCPLWVSGLPSSTPATQG